MLVNRCIGAARALGPRAAALRARSSGSGRAQLVVIPPMLGTRLRDAAGGRLWGYTRRLFSGPEVGAGEVSLDGALEHLPLLPGVYGHDVHGGLLDYMCRVGGYRRQATLHVLHYDWRRGVAFAAARLADLVKGLSGTRTGPVDLVGLSSGGLVARYYLRHGGLDVLDREEPPPATEAAARTVRRVVYVGTPHRGSLESLNLLENGFKLVPLLGRRYAAEDTARCQITYDLLPHPDERVFVDERSRPIDRPLHDVRTWRELGLGKAAPADLGARLEQARRLHRALDAPGSARVPTYVIGARHLPTRARVVVASDTARVPECPEGSVPDVREPGDGSVLESSWRGGPAGHADRVSLVTPSRHHDLPSDPDVHWRILEALLADEPARDPPPRSALEDPGARP